MALDLFRCVWIWRIRVLRGAGYPVIRIRVRCPVKSRHVPDAMLPGSTRHGVLRESPYGAKLAVKTRSECAPHDRMSSSKWSRVNVILLQGIMRERSGYCAEYIMH